MVQFFYRLKEINFSKLMTLYSESNDHNASELFENEEKNVAVLHVEALFYQYLNESFFKVDGAVYAIWEEKGVYISALRLEPYLDGLLLEALETHPGYRRIGYGTKLILSVQNALMEQGPVVLYSHIGKRNIASLKTHIACGFQRISEHAVYIDGSVTDKACTMRYMGGI